MNYYPMFWRLHRNLILSVNHFTTKSKGCWTILWFMILFKPIQRTDFTAPARKVQSWAWHIATQYTLNTRAATAGHCTYSHSAADTADPGSKHGETSKQRINEVRLYFNCLLLLRRNLQVSRKCIHYLYQNWWRQCTLRTLTIIVC